MERRHFGDGVEPGSGAGAVEPVLLAVDHRAHDHVVEGRGGRQQARDHVASLAAHQHGFGFDPHFTQHGEQQQRLGLAVAIAVFPRLGGHLRQVIAAVEAVEQVADLVLHHPQRQRGAFEVVVGLRSDSRDLLRDRTAGRHLTLGGEMRRHYLRHVAPVGEARNLQQRIDREARRRIIGHILWLGDRQDHFERAVAVLR